MSKIINGLRRIIGTQYVITDKQKAAPYTAELRQRYASDCLAVVLPATAQEVVEVVKFCGQHNLSLVPQGGNTGTMGGTVANKDQLIVNLKRLNKIIEIDAADYTMTVQSGCILATIRETAKQHDRLFPLSLGAQGSCQIGGNLATNAGGTNVLHYGNTRDLVLGIEVVLANGKISHGLNALRKNNSGYDLKNLFIGCEGTLGIITAAVLKLFPYPNGQIVALIGLPSVASGIALLSCLKFASSDRLTTFELMSQLAVQTAIKHIPAQTDPFDKPYPWYILAVIDSSEEDAHLKNHLEKTLAAALADGMIAGAVLAENQFQAQRLTLLREHIVEAQKFIGASIKHDVAVAVSKVAAFIDHADTAIKAFIPDARPYIFGHLGDGNIHFNISQPAEQAANLNMQQFLDNRGAVNTLIHDIVHQYRGSFSAEHGIGISKLDELEQYKDATDLVLHRQIKKLLDPEGLFNPGKVLRVER